MTQNVTMDFGIIKVEAMPAARAFVGVAGRVHANEGDAIREIATQELARIWCENTQVGWPPFQEIMKFVGSNPELFEAAAKLARVRS